MVKCWAWMLDFKKGKNKLAVTVVEEISGFKKTYLYLDKAPLSNLWCYKMIAEITKKRDRDLKRWLKK